jgi:hypothetical protein
MTFRILLSAEANDIYDRLAEFDPPKFRKVQKTLGLMETNLRSPGLKTHKYLSLKGPNGEEVFEAYVENRTPAAFRVFWCYGPDQGSITVLSITAHP